MIRSVITVVLSATILFLLATVMLPIAAGQDANPLFLPSQIQSGSAPIQSKQSGLSLPTPLPPSPALPAPLSPAPVQIQSPLAPFAAPQFANNNEDHWLVSIRHCKQNCRRCAYCCSLDFFRDCCKERVTQQDFVSALQPGVPVCIVVHGSYVTADSIQEECRRTFCWLRNAAPHRPLHVVFFTWPSEGVTTLDPGIAMSTPVPGFDVAVLGRRAEANGVRLAQLINCIPSQNPVSIIGHSHGARMVSSALHLIGGGQVQGLGMKPGPQHRIRTVLAAAAIDHDWLRPDERYGRVLCTTECLLNLKTRKDWALWFYPLRKPFSPASLGRKGFTDRDLEKLGDHAAQVSELDVTDWIGNGHMWPNYYEHPELAEAIAPVIYFDRSR